MLLGGLAVAAFFAWPRVARRMGRPAPAWDAAGLDFRERLERLNAVNPRTAAVPERMAARIQQLDDAGKAAEARRLRISFSLKLIRAGDFARANKQLERVLEDLEGEAPQVASERRRVRKLLIGSYLRQGELENCIANHNQDSCLFPLAGGGLHSAERGSRGAITHLLAALEEDPEDLAARWLLNLAYMTLGGWPQGVPAPFRLAPELFTSEYDLPRYYDVAPAVGAAVNGISGGVATEDFDLDGDLDIVASSMEVTDPLRYLENTGGAFVDRTDAAGLGDEWGGLNVVHADYDNDGYADVLVLRGAWMGEWGSYPNSLLRNTGGRGFENVTEQAGVLGYHPTQNAAWGDLNLDGWLDLFVGNESTPGNPHPSELFVASGDGTFRESIEASGIAVHGFVKGSAFGDVDNDGRADLFVSRKGAPSSLYRNEAAAEGGWRFRDVTAELGMGEFEAFPCWFFDYDNDGWTDLFVAGNAAASPDESEDHIGDILGIRLGRDVQRDGYPRLFRNLEGRAMSEVGAELGLRREVMIMGSNFGDLDNDGWLDVYLGTGNPDFRAVMPNRMFRNAEGRAFQDVTTSGGFGHVQKGHGIAFADLDNDGDQDVYAVMGGWFASDDFPNALFENPGNANRWVTLRLSGATSNRSAIGARVRVDVETPRGRRSIHRTVGTGGSFGSASLQQEIGLGDALRVERIEVHWPASDRTQTFEEVALDGVYAIREDGGLEPLDVTPQPFRSGGEHAGHDHAGHGAHGG